MSKLCKSCRPPTRKAFDEFHKSKTSPDGHVSKCKVCVKEYAREWRKRKLEDNPEYSEIRNAVRRKKLRADPEYRAKVYAKTNESERKRKQSDPEYRKKRDEQSTLCVKKRTERDPQWRQRKQEWAKQRKRFEENPEYHAAYRTKKNDYERERLRTDPAFKMKKYLRTRLRKVIRGNSKAKTSIKLVGCTQDKLKEHIESQFLPGMSWDNMGKKWQIDHIVPFKAFDMTCKEQQHIVMWYKNIQPLWKTDNRAKGAKYNEEDKQSLILRFRASHCF